MKSNNEPRSKRGLKSSSGSKSEISLRKVRSAITNDSSLLADVDRRRHGCARLSLNSQLGFQHQRLAGDLFHHLQLPFVK